MPKFKQKQTIKQFYHAQELHTHAKIQPQKTIKQFCHAQVLHTQTDIAKIQQQKTVCPNFISQVLYTKNNLLLHQTKKLPYCITNLVNLLRGVRLMLGKVKSNRHK